MSMNINLLPDPEHDVAAARSALALITAIHYDDSPPDTHRRELPSGALDTLVNDLFDGISLEPEAWEKLQPVVNRLARTLVAFAGVAYAMGTAGFTIGQEQSDAEQVDYPAIIRGTSLGIEATYPNA